MIPSQKPTPRLVKQDLLYAALLLVIGALAYLLFIGRQGLFGDDWYLIYDGHSRGAAFFQTVFNSDRPGRGLLFSALYSLFGDHLVLYHLSAFLWRFLASLAFIWSLNMVWNGNRRSNFLAGLFFLVYPGFLSQVQPVDYQPQILSLCLVMVSVALTVRIFKQPCLWGLKAVLFLLSVLTGWAYLALVEYAVGLEFLRLFFIACLVWQAPGVTTRSKLRSVLLGWLPFAIIPLGFAAWRFLIFENTRPATDAALQLGRLVDTPILTAGHWLLNLLSGAFNVLFSAWVVPFYERVIMADLRLREALIVLAIGAAALAACLLVARLGRHASAETGRHASRLAWLGWGGLITVITAALPVVVTNRTVDLETSRYTLAAAPGAALVLVALLGHLHFPRVQNWAAALLVSLAVAIHAGNALGHVRQAESLRDFWWQVVWRAPSIKPGTALVADYALMQAPEEYVIWGPANLVYYPQAGGSSVVPLSAALPDMATVNLLTGGGNGYQLDRRGVTVSVEPNQVLVLSQPEGGGCVRLLDGSRPEFSVNDDFPIRLLAPYSRLDRVIVEGDAAQVPAAIFGSEPQHGWCYYYQQAALARQRGDWAAVDALGRQAEAAGLSPFDRIEWLPFLQAHVALGQVDELRSHAGAMNEIPFIRSQTCRLLLETAEETHAGDYTLQELIQENFCPGCGCQPGD